MRALALAVPLLALPAAAIADADGLVQAAGTATVWNVAHTCRDVPLLVAVTALPDGSALATVARGDGAGPDPVCAILSTIPHYLAGRTAFPLEGSWEAGWSGELPGSLLHVGPYGDGSSVAVSGCALCFTAGFELWEGRVRDLGIDP